jgi:hypothetical protein
MMLFNAIIKDEIRGRFIQAIDRLVADGRALSYKDVCDQIHILPASLNQVKNKGGMPTIEMLYNLWAAYGVSPDSVLVARPPAAKFEEVNATLRHLQDSLSTMGADLRQYYGNNSTNIKKE